MAVKSKDGHYYNTLDEAINADCAWEEQRKEQREQNSLLAQQNELLNEQMQLQVDMAEKQMEFEREQAEMQRLELEKQREHEEKMRILGLFDSIGLNKQYYDNFIKYLTMKKNQNLTDIIDEKSEITYYLDKITKILKDPINTVEEELSDYNTFVEKNISDCYIVNENSKKLIKKYQACLNKPKELTEKDINNLSSYNKDKFEQIKTDKKNNIMKIKIYTILYFLIVLLLIILLEIMEDDSLFCIGLPLLIIIPILITRSWLYSKRNTLEMSKILENEINHIKARKLDEKKIINKCNKLKTNYNKQLKEINTKISEEILPKWNNFVEFRKKHYNSQFEKLLLDLNLKDQIEKLGIDYPKINANNKIGDGSIEDYIAYFDSL